MKRECHRRLPASTRPATRCMHRCCVPINLALNARLKSLDLRALRCRLRIGIHRVYSTPRTDPTRLMQTTVHTALKQRIFSRIVSQERRAARVPEVPRVPRETEGHPFNFPPRVATSGKPAFYSRRSKSSIRTSPPCTPTRYSRPPSSPIQSTS